MTLGTGSTVSGGSTPNASIPTFGQRTVRQVLGDPKKGDLVLLGGRAQIIFPGSYRDVRVDANAKLYITDGSYQFDSLVVQPGGQLVVETTGGVAVLWVRSRLALNGSVVPLGAIKHFNVANGNTLGVTWFGGMCLTAHNNTARISDIPILPSLYCMFPDPEILGGSGPFDFSFDKPTNIQFETDAFGLQILSEMNEAREYADHVVHADMRKAHVLKGIYARALSIRKNAWAPCLRTQFSWMDQETMTGFFVPRLWAGAPIELTALVNVYFTALNQSDIIYPAGSACAPNARRIADPTGKLICETCPARQVPVRTAGAFGSPANQDNCVPCPPGQIEQAGTCVACPANTITSGNACVTCALGQGPNASRTSCVQCQADATIALTAASCRGSAAPTAAAAGDVCPGQVWVDITAPTNQALVVGADVTQLLTGTSCTSTSVSLQTFNSVGTAIGAVTDAGNICVPPLGTVNVCSAVPCILPQT